MVATVRHRYCVLGLKLIRPPTRLEWVCRDSAMGFRTIAYCRICLRARDAGMPRGMLNPYPVSHPPYSRQSTYCSKVDEFENAHPMTPVVAMAARVISRHEVGLPVQYTVPLHKDQTRLTPGVLQQTHEDSTIPSVGLNNENGTWCHTWHNKRACMRSTVWSAFPFRTWPPYPDAEQCLENRLHGRPS